MTMNNLPTFLRWTEIKCYVLSAYVTLCLLDV